MPSRLIFHVPMTAFICAPQIIVFEFLYQYNTGKHHFMRIGVKELFIASDEAEVSDAVAVALVIDGGTV